MTAEQILIVAAGFGLLLIALKVLNSGPRTSGRFSGVTTEQFLAAIPDADPEIALRVRDIVAEQLDVPREEVHPESRFVEDLRAD